MKWILFILNEKSWFKVDASNDVYEVNIDTSFKILNYIKSCTLLDVLTLIRKMLYISKFFFKIWFSNDVSQSHGIVTHHLGTKFGKYIIFLTLNPNHKMNSINFIWNGDYPTPWNCGSRINGRSSNFLVLKLAKLDFPKA